MTLVIQTFSESTITANRVVRNPHLAGLQCLRCDAAYPLALVHAGCPVCARQGVFVSLRASYRKQTGSAHYLPYGDAAQLGEGCTPLVAAPGLARTLGLASLHIKDESKNPTGSHKDRMSAIGIQQAIDFGAHTVVLASSGNAAVSAAHYAHAAGLACEVATYADMPKAYADALDVYGARRFEFDDNLGRWAYVAKRAAQPGIFALTNYHLPALGSAPLAIEGYKAIAYECVSQGCLPEHIVVPTARGDLAWGIYAGFRDLLEAGQIQVLPKIWVVEPFARLSKVLSGEGLHQSYPGQTSQFSTAGATVTYLQWQAVTASGGGALVVPDAHAMAARAVLSTHGISAELCAAAGFAAIEQLHAVHMIDEQSKLLLVLTANASRDPSYQGAQPALSSQFV
jgi:threonine synthase